MGQAFFPVHTSGNRLGNRAVASTWNELEFFPGQASGYFFGRGRLSWRPVLTEVFPRVQQDPKAKFQDWRLVHARLSQENAMAATWQSVLLFSPVCPVRPSRVFSSDKIGKNKFLLYGPTLISIQDYWKNHSVDYVHFVSKVMSLLSRQYCFLLLIVFSFSLREFLLQFLQKCFSIDVFSVCLSENFIFPSILNNNFIGRKTQVVDFPL